MPTIDCRTPHDAERLIWRIRQGIRAATDAHEPIRVRLGTDGEPVDVRLEFGKDSHGRARE